VFVLPLGKSDLVIAKMIHLD